MKINKTLRLAYQHYQAGNINTAKTLYEKILKSEPNNFNALHFLEMICSQTGDFDNAIRYIKKEIELMPSNVDLYIKIGSLLMKKNLFSEAIDYLKKALNLKPFLPDAYFNLGFASMNIGQFDDAINFYRKALEINPYMPEVVNNLANALKKKEQFDEAIKYYKEAIKLNPNYALAYYNLANTYREKGQFYEAIIYYKQTLNLNPNLCAAYNNLGGTFMEIGQLYEAEIYYKYLLKIKPDDHQYHSNLLLNMNYNPRYSPQDIYNEHIAFAKKFEEPLSHNIPIHTNKPEPYRRLKIGYCSPDFRRHPVAYFIEPVLATHDRENFEIFCYTLAPIEDDLTKRIQNYSDHWKSIVDISDDEAAKLIRNDEIDILIDLAGHTGNNRILIFARKPAPIQVNWIGYLTTTGLSTMDYKIVDAYIDPPGKTEQFYSEKLIRLPESFLCYLPDKDSPEVGPLPALSKGYITFGSLNKFSKITPEVITLWSKILKELPDSHLMLKGKSFSDKKTCQYALNMFEERGISPERIILQPWDPSPKHLESYNQIDIALDTFPFNGATTTCEAMWMGVPVITLEGTAYHSRAGVSLLSNVGLPELIAKTQDEYIKIAIDLASNISKLQSLRKSLRDKMSLSPICDAKRFTTNLEMCYRKMWIDWCKMKDRQFLEEKIY